MGETRVESARAKIRGYLEELFTLLAYEPEGQWPDVPVGEFQKVESRLVARVLQMDGQLALQQGSKRKKREQRVIVWLYGEFVRHLLWLDWAIPAQTHESGEEYTALLEGRPESMLENFDQLFCTVNSTHRRIERMLEDVDPTGGKVLCLGDDDLCSVLLAQRGFAGEIHVIDIDDRLLEYIGQKAPQVECHKVDLVLGGIPKRFEEHFDAIFLDPPWDERGAWFFLHKAMYCLRRHPKARIYLSYCPLYLEYDDRAMGRFYKRMGKLGFAIEEQIRCFNLYSLGEDNNPQLTARVKNYELPLESSLFAHFREVPYAFSNLYTLRRQHGHRMNPLQRKLFSWWHGGG